MLLGGGLAVVLTLLFIAWKIDLVRFGSGGASVPRDPQAAATPISLTSQVSGTLPVGNGGTGVAALTQNLLLSSDGSVVTQNANLVLHSDLGTLGQGTATPFGLLSIDALQGTVGSNTPIFVIGDSATETPFLYVSGVNGNIGIATDSPANPLSVDTTSLFVGTTTIGTNLTVGGSSLVKGPVSDCIETYEAGSSYNIDLAQGCKTKVIPENTADASVGFDNVGGGSWSGELWVYNDDPTKQLSFASSSAAYQFEIGGVKDSATTTEQVPGLNIYSFKVVSTSSIPTLRLDPGAGSLPR